MEFERPIRVLICEDSEPILAKYQIVLSKDKDLEVVGTANNGYAAAVQAAALRPDVILMDIKMESAEAGIDASKQILTYLPHVHIIILSVYLDDDLVYKAFQTGVINYLNKDVSSSELIQAIKDAYSGLTTLPPIVAEKLRREFARVTNYNESLVYTLHKLIRLTATELDILNLLIKGYSRTEICKMRYVEMTTVSTQIRSILKKMEKGHTRELVESLISLGIDRFIDDAAQKQFADNPPQEPDE